MDNKIKNNFPFFNNNPEIVYLDSAATTLKPQSVIKAISEYYEKYSVNPHSEDYPLTVKCSAVIDETRQLVSEFINSKQKEEIIFCASATFAFNQIAFGLAKYLKAGDEIILSELEHSSLLLPFFRLAQIKKIKINFVALDKTGAITSKNLMKVLTKNTKLVAFANINNSLAWVNDTLELTKTIKAYGKKNLSDDSWPFKNIMVLVDGAQSVGHLKTDVIAWGIDFLAFSGHKICAPTGIGVLYSRMEWLQLLEPMLLGGGMNGRIFKENYHFSLNEIPACFEAGTLNMAGIFGLRAAIEFLLNCQISAIQKHEATLKAYAIEQFKKLGNKVIIYNPETAVGTLIFNVKNVFAQDVSSFLGAKNICLRSGTYCSKLIDNVIKVEAAIRASFYLYTTKVDIDRLVAALKLGINSGGDFLNEFF